jgi:hypothetical protein
MDFNINNLTEDEKFALLYGIMLGDGCISKYKSGGRKYIIFSISGDYYSDRSFYLKVLCPLIDSIRKNKKPIKIKERLGQGKLEIQFSDKELVTKFTKLGFPLGKKGTKLKIPKWFFQKNLVKQIIQGLFATDGSLVLTKNPNKYYPRLEVHLIAPKVINQTNKFLISKNIAGKVYECKRNKIDPRFKIVQKKFRVQINGKENLLLFNKKIGFANPKHKEKFLNFLRYSKEYDKNILGIPCNKHNFIRNKVKL